MIAPENRFVFGYGSLIWRPGFTFVAAYPALLRGLHRSLSVISHHHRGTEAHPGLTFGLIPGGSCRGMAFEVEPHLWDQTRTYLREREQVTSVYLERECKVTLADGRSVPALTYIVDVHHPHFAGALDVARQADLVRNAIGQSGPNIEYVLNTVQHLAAMGISDRLLAELAELLLVAR